MSNGGDFEEVVMTSKEIDALINGTGDVKNEKGESLVLKQNAVQDESTALPMPEAASEKLRVGDGVEKQVLKAGTGDSPKKHATCFGKVVLCNVRLYRLSAFVYGKYLDNVRMPILVAERNAAS